MTSRERCPPARPAERGRCCQLSRSQQVAGTRLTRLAAAPGSRSPSGYGGAGRSRSRGWRLSGPAAGGTIAPWKGRMADAAGSVTPMLPAARITLRRRLAPLLRITRKHAGGCCARSWLACTSMTRCPAWVSPPGPACLLRQRRQRGKGRPAGLTQPAGHADAGQRRAGLVPLLRRELAKSGMAGHPYETTFGERISY